MNNPRIILFTQLFIGLLLLPSLSQAQTNKATTENGNWNDVVWTPAGIPSATDDVFINNDITIPYGTSVEVNNLNLQSQGKLTVEGQLKVNGDLYMENNSPEFIMGNQSLVLITGNFTASNKVDISLSSYIIIQGDFTRSSNSNQANVGIDQGNIYIFGDVSGFGDLSSCGANYQGTTSTVTATCDYGNSTAYINNQDSFPADVQDFIKCFDVSTLQDVNTCEGQDVIFSINPITNVHYQWQVETSTSSWTNLGTDSPQIQLSAVTVAMDSYKYRVLITPVDPASVKCQLAISNAAHLSVASNVLTLSEVTGPTSVCSPATNIVFSIDPVANAASYSWNIPSGWTINSGASSNQITLSAATNAQSGNITVKVISTCGTSQSSQLAVVVSTAGKWNGVIDSNWNNPGNWDCNIIPDSATNVLITSGLTNYPVLETGATGQAKNITIDSGASLTVSDNTLEIFGNVTFTSPADFSSGTVFFKGNSTQTIPAGSFVNDIVENLYSLNPSEVISEGNLIIAGVLRINSGNFETSNLLTLKSDALQTALIDGSGTGTISGSVKMQRFLDPAFGYKYISSPFQNSTVSDLLSITDPTSTIPVVYTYNEDRTDTQNNDASGWESYTDPAGILETLKGYAVQTGAGNTPRILELQGTINNGDFNRILYNKNHTYTKGFNLVGNPYPSPVDWNSPGWTKTNIDDAIYFFRSAGTDKYTGTYSSFVNGLSSDGVSTSIIPSMQGFFVHVTDGSYPVAGVLGTSNSIRVNDFSQAFLKLPKYLQILLY